MLWVHEYLPLLGIELVLKLSNQLQIQRRRRRNTNTRKHKILWVPWIFPSPEWPLLASRRRIGAEMEQSIGLALLTRRGFLSRDNLVVKCDSDKNKRQKIQRKTRRNTNTNTVRKWSNQLGWALLTRQGFLLRVVKDDKDNDKDKEKDKDKYKYSTGMDQSLQLFSHCRVFVQRTINIK